jgi:S-DNA-T family DNA segregation ATPase FtsK/SpoIIIE
MQPEKHKGRGLFRQNKDNLLEFQTASITKQNPPYGYIRELVEKMTVLHPNIKAASVPILPEIVTEQFLAPYAEKSSLNRTPIGVERETLDIAYYNFADAGVNLVLSTDREWKGFVDSLGMITANRMDIKTMMIAPGNIDIKPGGENLNIFTSADDCAVAVQEIENILLSREKQIMDGTVTGNEQPLEPVLIIIQSLSTLQPILEQYIPTETENTEDGTAGAIGNFYNRLKLVMEKCGKRTNTYVLVAEGLNTLTSFVYDNWYALHINGANGIWAGSGISTQFRLTISKLPPNYMAETGPEFGFTINNSTATSVKFLQ